jgi:LysR substrate binding domain
VLLLAVCVPSIPMPPAEAASPLPSRSYKAYTNCVTSAAASKASWPGKRSYFRQSFLEAEQGVSIVPACVRNLRSDGVRFYRLQPDEVRVELVAVWKKETPSVALRAFLDLIDAKAPLIRKKAEIR